MVFADDMADDRNLHEVRLSYNRMASLLVFIANAFTLMYVGSMDPQDSIWYGAVSGSFTFAILTNASLTAERLDDLKRSRSSRSREKAKPMSMPMMPQMMQQQPMQQQQVQQQPMQPTMGQQNFLSDEKEYIDPKTGEIKPIQEAEMLD